MFTQRSKLVHAEIIALVQIDDMGRMNYVQLPNIIKVFNCYIISMNVDVKTNNTLKLLLIKIKFFDGIQEY